MRTHLASQRLSVLVAAVAALGADGARAQSPGTTAALFGANAGSARVDLEALCRLHGAACRAVAPVTDAATGRLELPVVSDAPPIAAPVPLTATYWYEGDVLSRAFLVASSAGGTLARDLAEDRRQFNVLQAWVTRQLGAPTTPLQVPPGWSGTARLSDADQMKQLLLGRARLSETWQLNDGSVELWLAGEGGRVVLALGLRANAGHNACSATVVNEALLDLFPPA
ncbi:MAG TPA: hypothetical protein VH560_13700, partial [Polyangia bacterium]|nr:hypothetical protein [Polyangia bacterium]